MEWISNGSESNLEDGFVPGGRSASWEWDCDQELCPLGICAGAVLLTVHSTAMPSVKVLEADA